MKPIRNYKYQASDYSQASLYLTEIGNVFAVDRILPAGMDIAPDRWKYKSLEAALNRFMALDSWLTDRGFKLIQSAQP